MQGVEGLKSIARQRAEHEKDRLLFESAHDSSQVSNMFLADENQATSEDSYDETISGEILKGSEADELDKLIDQIPESNDVDDDKLIDAILSAENDLTIEDLYEGKDD